MKPPSLKKLFYLLGLWAVLTLSLVQIWVFVGAHLLEVFLYRNNLAIQQAKEAQTLQDISFYAWTKRILWIAIPTTTIGLAVTYVFAVARARLKQAAVHTYKIGKSEVVVHERDLHLAAPIGLGLMTAEQMRQSNAGEEKAFALCQQMLETQATQWRAFSRGQKPLPAPALSENAATVATESAAPIPTFHDLLNQGLLAQGQPMILGYTNGVPRRGSFLDIYSAAVAGESGSGKTATLLFLMGSALIAMPVKFFAIDPHYPHPKSLGFKTKALWQAGLITLATYKDDMVKVLRIVEETIDRRLQQLETDTTPVVLVIDELVFLSKTSIGPAVAQTMERISTEGRKCAVYLLASSQTWLVSRTGASSAVRDTLTSAYVHRIKPRQANLLLQDRDETEKVKRSVKHAGEALFCPVGSESVIVKIPFTTETDLERVAALVQPLRRPAPLAIESPRVVPELTIPKDLLPQTETELDFEFQRLVTNSTPHTARG